MLNHYTAHEQYHYPDLMFILSLSDEFLDSEKWLPMNVLNSLREKEILFYQEDYKAVYEDNKWAIVLQMMVIK